MSDSENDHSVPEVLSRVQMVGILDRNRNFDNNRIEQRFSDKNRQIRGLTNIDLSLTQKLSYIIREENGLNMLSIEPNSRPDRSQPLKLNVSLRNEYKEDFP